MILMNSAKDLKKVIFHLEAPMFIAGPSDNLQILPRTEHAHANHRFVKLEAHFTKQPNEWSNMLRRFSTDETSLLRQDLPVGVGIQASHYAVFATYEGEDYVFDVAQIAQEVDEMVLPFWQLPEFELHLFMADWRQAHGVITATVGAIGAIRTEYGLVAADSVGSLIGLFRGNKFMAHELTMAIRKENRTLELRVPQLDDVRYKPMHDATVARRLKTMIERLERDYRSLTPIKKPKKEQTELERLAVRREGLARAMAQNDAKIARLSAAANEASDV